MIPQSNAKSAIAVAQEFDRRGLIMVPVAGTPLAKLVDLTHTLAPAVGTSSEYIPDAGYIEASSTGYLSNVASSHTQEMEALSAQIADAVSQHLNFAKNVVRPVVEELVTEVQADINALTIHPEYSLDVVCVDLPEPLVLSSFEEMVEEFKEVNYTPINNYISLVAKTPEEILQTMVTGIDEIDEAVTAWATRRGDAFFQNVWNTVFTHEPTQERFEVLVSNNDTGIDAAITVFLLCKRLYDNPPEGTLLPLVKYNEQIAELRDQAALRIQHGYGDYARSKSLGLIIRNVTKNELFVNGEVYRKWIENGGKNAVLFGSILSERPAKFIADLDAKAAEFVQIWEQHNHMLSVTVRNKRFVNYKTILLERTEQVIGNNLKECFGPVANNRALTIQLEEVGQGIARLKCYLDTLKESDFDNLWMVCTQAVCEAGFFYTSADKILFGIEKACRENANIEVREAALLSLVEYVTDYVCDQIHITGSL
ncbi:MAG: hypothetical protein PHQ58_05160 [Rhodoferax sp.]|uniref:hypothetical protein n=1 Tax=Rhodoferax sp. TaxID=50421 RepID=UPI00262A376A|nr:hypothetical protein [Rhodoferax sp.]MDD2879804.1 hypothetical protein [Rhodoferax sp.]